MKNLIKLFLVLNIIFCASCNSNNGKLDYRDISTKYSRENIGNSEEGSKEIFLINTSSDKKLKFTLKRTDITYSSETQSNGGAASVAPSIENTTVINIFETLEPGAETSLGLDKYRTSEGGGLFGNSHKSEVSFEIVGSREDKN